jgi:hypothetical protein
MKSYRYLDNAFWEVPDKSVLKCIRITDLDGERTKKDILTVKKIMGDGSLNPQYKEVVDAVGMNVIDRYTQQRQEEKELKRKEHEIKKEQEAQANMLEGLFSAKLRAFEIDEVKNSKNKPLRSRIRRAKNEMELNALVTLIIGEEMGLFGNKDE